jgi:excinuclease UvrABC helicase subunit UvrB
MYADAVTDSMARALRETERRRDLQRAYNEANGITPVSIQKAIGSPLVEVYEADYATVPIVPEGDGGSFDREDAPRLLRELRQAMREAAEGPRVRARRRDPRSHARDRGAARATEERARREVAGRARGGRSGEERPRARRGRSAGR